MGSASSANVIIPKAFTEYDANEFTNSRQIGEGGFSIVSYANHQKLGDVATKELYKYVRKEDFREAFLLFEKGHHPHIIQIFGILTSQITRLSTSPMCSGIVMEFMETGSLEKIIHDHSIEYESKQIYRWIYFISNGLNYLHGVGIIHRDIKPSNILLGKSLDDLRISDFGLARQLDTGSSLTSGTGTMAYMAPEILNKEPYSKPADIYSLAITIWEILSRSKAYGGFPGVTFISSVLAGRRPEIVTENSLKWFFSLVSPAESELIQKLLNKGWHDDSANRPYARAFLDFSRRIVENSVRNQVKELEQVVFFGQTIEQNSESSELGFHSSALVLGGCQDGITDSIVIFDSKENKWRMCKQKLPFKVPFHGSAILNGKIYFMGGCHDLKESLADCYKLEESGEWTKMAEMNEKRSNISQSTIVFDSEIWVIGGSNESNALKTVERYNPQTNIWTKMPDLNFEQPLPSASIIGGKVFVSAGWDGMRLKSVEVYDPAENKWEIFCDMPLELSWHSSIVEGTNLIIIGGIKSDDTPSDEVWKIDVFDPKKEWIEMPSLNQGRYGHGAVKLSNGIMVLGGSIDKATRIDSVEIFDGTSWTEGPKLPEKQGGFSSFPLSIKTERQLLLQYFGDKGDEILKRKFEKQHIEMRQQAASSELGFHSSALVLGGYHDYITDSIVIFDSKENKWRAFKKRLPVEVAFHGSAILNGKIYIMGGQNNPKEPLASCYKLEENGEWDNMADMNEKRSNISQSTIVFDSEIWVIGGWNGEWQKPSVLNTVERYNPQTNIWTKMPDLNFKRSSSSASIVGGKIFVSGGWNRTQRLKSVEVYDPAKSKWEIFCDMPLELSSHSSIVEGTNLIIIGGRKSNETLSDEVWKIDVFDPKKKWIKMPSLKQGRYDHGAVKLSNGIMVFGGSIVIKTLMDSVEIFDGTSWTEGPKLPEKCGIFSSIPLSLKTERQLLLQLF